MPFEFKDDISSELTFEVDIYRHTSIKNVLTGEVSETFSLLTSKVKCLIQPLGGRQLLKVQGLNIEASHTGYFFFDTDIQERDKVLYNARWYDVKYIEKDFCNMSHHYEILLKIDAGTPNMTEVL